MAERKVLVDGVNLKYEGLFNFKDLYNILDSWLAENSYDKREHENLEKVTPTGKFIRIELRPWRTSSDYEKVEMKIVLTVHDMVDVVVEKDGMKMKLNKGSVSIVFSGFLLTDVEGRWTSKAFFFFLSQVFDKFIYKTQLGRLEATLKHDVMMLHKTLKSFLNMHRY